LAARVVPWARFAGTVPTIPCVGLIGLADDTGVKLNRGLQGARAGPAAFRAALARYGVAEPMDGHPWPTVVDCGDVQPGATLEETHGRVTAVTEAVFARGLTPVAIGGGHDLTFPFVRAAATAAGVARVVYLDPHLDVRAEPGSGMPFRALVEQAGVRQLLNIGAEPMVNTAEHCRWFTAHGGTTITLAEAAQARWRNAFDSPTPTAASLDLDAIDAAAMPAVSALNPCGATVSQAAAFAFAAGQAQSVRAFDVMELNPLFDPDGRGARAAVYCFLSFLRGLSSRTARGAQP
jgi:arginase family enzyme